MPPRSLSPSGIILADKPAGPSSFAIVAAVRRKTRCAHRSCGHARPVRDRPPAAAVRGVDEAPAALRRPRQALRDGDRSERDDDDGRSGRRGRRGARGPGAGRAGETSRASSEAPSSSRSRRPPRSRSRASARTSCTGAVWWWRCRRARMHVHELTLESYADGLARLELLVSSGTYVRSIAEALGGHCRTLRRTEIGPFSVEEADATRSSRPSRRSRGSRREGRLALRARSSAGHGPSPSARSTACTAAIEPSSARRRRPGSHRQ